MTFLNKNPLQSDDLQKHITATYTSLRWGLVVIAFAFPVLLYVGGRFFGDLPFGDLPLLDSMSQYYHSVMRNPFVGFLFAIGACLYLYKGFTLLENYLLNAAALFAVGVAVFPTACRKEIVCNTFTASKPHGISAVLAFLCIALVCWFCASDTLSEMKDKAKARRYRKWYKIIGVAMLVSPLAAVILTFTLSENSLIFFVELAAMWVFATYWLVKSVEIRETNAEEKAAARQLTLQALE